MVLVPAINVLPGIIPQVKVPYLTVILADGIIFIPRANVLADTHLAPVVTEGLDEK